MTQEHLIPDPHAPNARTVSDWTPVRTGDGSMTLRRGELGEACHDLAGAWTEACERYAIPAQIAARAREGCVRLLDVGTGLGWNLAAALDAAGAASGRLEVVTLELDRRVIEAALELSAAGGIATGEAAQAHLPVARALAQALADSACAERGVSFGAGRLRLFLGDAHKTLCALPPGEHFDAVFLDPFSPRADRSAWAAPFLAEIARRMAPHARLATYTAAFEVRLALVAAGLTVGRGPRVGRKAEGTVAGLDIEVEPLHPRTARRLERRVRAARETECSAPEAR